MKRRSRQTFNYALIGIELTCPRQMDSEAKFDERMWPAIESYTALRRPHDWINFYRQRAVHFLRALLRGYRTAIGDPMTSIPELIDTRVD